MSVTLLLDSNHLFIPRIEIDNIQKDLLSFALLRIKFFVALLVAFISAILWRLGLDTVFGDFLENKNKKQKTKQNKTKEKKKKIKTDLNKKIIPRL